MLHLRLVLGLLLVQSTSYVMAGTLFHMSELQSMGTRVATFMGWAVGSRGEVEFACVRP